MTLEPDRDQIETFFDAVFRHRGQAGYLSLRTFIEGEKKPILSRMWTANLVGHNFKGLIDHAVDMAGRAANNPTPAVFCPPLAVFNGASGWQAGEKDLLLGLALSVECDQHPKEARVMLEDLLGEATAVVSSGGQWVSEHGEAEDKLHLHWRLKTPARKTADEDTLKDLKTARALATVLVGGDPSNVPAVHCLRVPGSWHRKDKPRQCRIVSLNPNREIDLGEALAALEKAAPTPGIGHNANGGAGDHWTGDGARIDLVKLLAGMKPGNIHTSQVSATAALLERGMKLGDVVDTTLAVTRLAVGEIGQAWDWAKEARDLRGMCETWEKKRNRPEPPPEPAPVRPVSTSRLSRPRW